MHCYGGTKKNLENSDLYALLVILSADSYPSLEPIEY